MSACNVGDLDSIPGLGRSPGEGNGYPPTPVFLPGESQGRRSLVGCGPWGREESDTTERFHCHFSLSCTGEGNSNPLQCSCLENPRDGEAWWAAIYGVAQSRTQLKRLSSSSSSKATYRKCISEQNEYSCPHGAYLPVGEDNPQTIVMTTKCSVESCTEKGR